MSLEDSANLVKRWMLSLPTDKQQEFTPEVDAAMKELWNEREKPTSRLHIQLIHVFEAVLAYKVEEEHFSPYYFEKQERLANKWEEITRRASLIEKEAAGQN